MREQTARLYDKTIDSAQEINNNACNVGRESIRQISAVQQAQKWGCMKTSPRP